MLTFSLSGTVIKIHEPVGVIGVACPDKAPLLSFVSLFGAAIARSNSVVIVPSEKYPVLALQMYQVTQTSHYGLNLPLSLSRRYSRRATCRAGL